MAKIIVALVAGIGIILLVALARSAVPDTLQRLKCINDRTENSASEDAQAPL